MKKGGDVVGIVNIIEVIAESDESWESAAREAVAAASARYQNIQSMYVENQQAIVRGDKIVKFRVNAKISYLVE
jgi:hypothetical protein